MSEPHRAAAGRALRWLAAAVGTVLVVLTLTVGFQAGSCFDAAEGQGDSYCTTGPAIGDIPAWVLAACGAAFTLFALWRAVAAARSAATARRATRHPAGETPGDSGSQR